MILCANFVTILLQAMTEHQEILNGTIEDYFGTIEDSFYYRKKNIWKKIIAIILTVLSAIFVFVNLIPILPTSNIQNGEYLINFYEYYKPFLGLENVAHNFWTKWITGIFLSVSIYGVVRFFTLGYEKRFNRKALNLKHLSFCYSFLLRKKVKGFILNGNDSQLDNGKKYFKELIKPYLALNLKEFHKNDVATISYLEIQKRLSQKLDYIKFTDKSNKLIKTISFLNSEIQKRIENKVQLEEIEPILDYLTLYEFVTIRPKFFEKEGYRVDKIKKEYIENIVIESEKINEIEIKKLEKDKIDFSLIRSNIFNLFYSENMFKLIFSWFTFLLIIISLLFYFVFNLTGIELNSNSLIALLTTTILVSGAIAAAIYTKKK